jgi:hypothetical protein
MTAFVHVKALGGAETAKDVIARIEAAAAGAAQRETT